MSAHPSDLLPLVERQERDALARLTDATSGGALCRLDGSGVGEAKYWEGRAAALAQVRRELRRGADPRRETVDRRLAAWRAETAALSAGASPAWSAYLAGGVDALAALLEDARPAEAVR